MRKRGPSSSLTPDLHPPSVASGLPFPLPWYYVLLNLYYALVVIVICRWDRRLREVQRYIEDYIAGDMVSLEDLSQRPPPGVKYLVANLLEIEFPLTKIPPHIIPCGPFIHSAEPASKVDPALARWLARGPTVHIKLGTHAKTTESIALEIAKAVVFLLRAAQNEGGEADEVALKVL